MEQENNVLQSLCRQHGWWFASAYAAFRTIGRSTGMPQHALYTDGIHPNRIGQVVLRRCGTIAGLVNPASGGENLWNGRLNKFMKRIRFFDIAKGMAILAVILGHSAIEANLLCPTERRKLLWQSVFPFTCHFSSFCPVTLCIRNVSFDGRRNRSNCCAHML